MNFDIYIEGIIGQDVTVATVRAQYEMRPKGTTEITLKINSGGGSVDEGFAIYDYLTTLPEVAMGTSMKVNTEVLGMCGSIATIIQQVAIPTKGERTIHKNSKDFIHNPYWRPDAPIPIEAKDAKALHESLQREEERILNFYVEHTGKSKEVLRAKMDAKTELTPSEAVDLNLVDRVIENEVQSLRSYQVVAFINEPKITIMDLLKAFREFEAKITSLIPKKTKNLMAQTAEGVKLFYDGALAQGTACFSDEAMTTPVTDGAYTIENKKYTITGGKVSAIEDVAAAADTTALKAENETLKGTIAEKETALGAATTENTSLKAELAEAKASIEKVGKEFVAFKSQFITGTGEVKPEFQHFKGDETQPKTEKQKQLNNIGKKLADQLS